VTGIAIQRLDARIGVLIGLVALILGPIVTIGFVFAHSLPGLVVGSAIAGVGFGAGFQAPLRMLLATAAPTHRAGLLSTIYIVSYLAFGVPAVIGGLLEPTVGLVPVLAGYGAFIVVAAGVALVLQLTSKEFVTVEEAAAEAVERTATGSVRTI
jgi:MFS family permease